ncbi:MAG TPA: tRNA lysidine(34) synthetase TilS [Mollicutes bacterium]|nr:tRNA lysidine(34) synthetase TilS [Mollicutes bacterium]
MKAVLDSINYLNINKEDYIVLACSYGPDSMVLLDILLNLNFKVVIAHVNHKIRKESDKEMLSLKKFAKDNNIIFELKEINEYPEGNFESNAREIRYNFFEEILKKYNSKHLFTAHHGDDLIETILMRLVRGSNFKGYAGFKEVTNYKNYNIYRPLIHITKESILKYAKDKNIPYEMDHTNYEDDYTRNRYRNNIIPLLKKENKDIHKKFLNFSKETFLYEEYLEEKTIKYYQEIYKNNTIEINKFLKLNEIFQNRLLEKILFNIYKENINKITNKHKALIFDLIKSNKQNSYIDLPLNLKVLKSYNILQFKFNDEKDVSYNLILEDKLNINNNIFKYLKEDINDNSNFIIRLNSKDIKLPLKVRTRKNGDRISVKNLKGTKKVKEIFIENKINLENRNKYPLVVDDNDTIIWIPGLKKSEFDKQKPETYDIIIKYEKKEKINEKENI